MPKKGKKKDDKKGKEVVGPPEVNEVNENHKSYYIKQIRELESEVTASVPHSFIFHYFICTFITHALPSLHTHHFFH